MVKTSISTTYKSVEGWHVFVSEDLPGLYVASRDLYSAYQDVAQSIKALLKLDEGIDCFVSPEVPLQEFLAAIKGASPDHDDFSMANRRFAVIGAHV